MWSILGRLLTQRSHDAVQRIMYQLHVACYLYCIRANYTETYNHCFTSSLSVASKAQRHCYATSFVRCPFNSEYSLLVRHWIN
jgi:hypothetical protein